PLFRSRSQYRPSFRGLSSGIMSSACTTAVCAAPENAQRRRCRVLKHFHALLLGLFFVFNATSRAAASEPWFDEAALERAVVSARIQGTPEVVIPPGVHRMSRQVNIRAVENLVIDGQGATLLFTSRDAGLHIASARGLTLKNLTIDYDPLPFTQGTIVNIDPSGVNGHVKMDTNGHEKSPRLAKK